MTPDPCDPGSPEPGALERLFDALRHDGLAVADGLLPRDLLQALAAECDALQGGDALRPAGVGRGAAHHLDAAVRGDSIAWIDPDAPSPAQVRLLQAMQGLRRELNRALLLGLEELEAHFSVYPAGVGYARHRDRFRDDDARVLSIVIYLNPDWRPGDGGELRLHLLQGPFDVEPRMGTVVLFLSAEVEHEVLATRRTRRSIAGWFRRHP